MGGAGKVAGGESELKTTFRDCQLNAIKLRSSLNLFKSLGSKVLETSLFQGPALRDGGAVGLICSYEQNSQTIKMYHIFNNT